MGDYLFDNMLSAFLEAINFLVWFIPIALQIFVAVLSPFVGLSIIGFLAVVRGWDKVSETLTDKWIEKAESVGWVRYENFELAQKVISTGAQVTVIAGITLNISLILFTIWIVVAILKLVH